MSNSKPTASQMEAIKPALEKEIPMIYHEITLRVLLDGIALHAFGGKAPFSEKNLERIRDLKKIYHLDFDSRASHRLRGTPPPRKSKAKP